MNCPVRTDPDPEEGHNQNPPELAPELTTRKSLNSIRRESTDKRVELINQSHAPAEDGNQNEGEGSGGKGAGPTARAWMRKQVGRVTAKKLSGGGGGVRSFVLRVRNALIKYAKFIGPGFMVSVAYIDPGNYATDVAAGATYRYRLLFIVLLSNLFAIFLQSLCVKLGTVTGMNLAEACKAHLPLWLNYVLYVFAEGAIIATDIAEVIGTAIALNILLKVPLVAGCALAIVDVLVILIFYNPTGMSMRALRTFEVFVILLVLGVVVCFCYELSKISNTGIGEVFKGYLPSSALVESKGLYQSCGILGATVMPHSLYLGSGIVQNRLRDFDERNNSLVDTSDSDSESSKYLPSLSAIQACMRYSIVELSVSLFTFALFVNSAILIVSGASLSELPKDQIADADLFSIHDLLSRAVAPAAGTIFALALLLSGTSAGLVCTIAGQMVSEGQLDWSVRPWVRRLVTRAVSILPSIVIAGAVGRPGLARALEGSQVALSIILPVVSAPLIWFTWSAKIMTVAVDRQPAALAESNLNDAQDDSTRGGTVPVTVSAAIVVGTATNKTAKDVQASVVPASTREQSAAGPVRCEAIIMKNGWVTAICSLVVWGIITVMNIALLVLLGLGVE